MTHHLSHTVILAAALCAIIGAEHHLCAQVQGSAPRPDLRQLLQKLTTYKPDPCGPPFDENADSTEDESLLFRSAEELVILGLNENAADSDSPRDHATKALKKLEQMSAEVNATWPEENRFHFQILDLPPALVVKMTIRTHGRSFVLGIPREDLGKPNLLWKETGRDEELSVAHIISGISVNLYPLRRGPAGNARFLAVFNTSGCAGSTGVSYDAREWNPNPGSLDKLIDQSGVWGLDDKVPGFPQIGELRTKGPLISLPYCRFTSIDTWDNPSLCAVDTYDLSGDDVKFRSRIYNRPDLLPIAKAIEYAQQRDYPALLAYCASAHVARKMIREIPPSVFAEDLQVIHMGRGKERVLFCNGYHFDVEKRAGRWRVVRFRTENSPQSDAAVCRE